jgi:hypothetical protein
MPSAAGPPPTPAQLRERADRLLYEVLMLCNTAALLDQDRGANDGWQELTQYMALVESFLTHTRSLLGFLYPPRRVLEHNRRKPSEIYALDYCGSSWRARRWNEVATVRSTIRRDVRHLSFAGLPVAPSGEYARVVAALKTSLCSFLDDASGLSVVAKSRLRAALDQSAAAAGGAEDSPRPSMPVPAIPVPSRFAAADSRS